MNFTEIDLMTWPRGQMFYYFSQMAPTSYSLTVELDVTELYVAMKKRAYKLFPAYLWVVTKCLNKQIEFKVTYKDEKLGYYDTLTPLYACFHEDDKTFSLMWTEFDDDFDVFYRKYLENQDLYGKNHGVLAQPETPPPANAYTVSCVPWVDFKHFAVHSHDNKPYFFPSIEAGKITENTEGRKIMPLSLTCHHATTDGYHIKTFLDDLASEMKHISVVE
uniref:Putative chloramphenicol acetyltransferase n=1 Tax=uncultured bacterium fosmid pJB77G10 TaxID=1478069 RepID=A0A0H3U814_9BACT|nr:putative chloramphenicol acetyltransferase [uncultured bacterium fosmid pJB77G10]